jgi:serine/threonine protein kinase/anti-sigma factor RsiW
VDCQSIVELLDAELAGELPDAESGAVRQHLLTCAECARKRATLVQRQLALRSFTDLDCADVAKRLKAWLDGELSADEVAAVSLHLRKCPDCMRKQRRLRRAQSHFRFLAEMNCFNVSARLRAELDGKLPAEEAWAVRRHVLACPECARKRGMLEQGRHALRSDADANLNRRGAGEPLGAPQVGATGADQIASVKPHVQSRLELESEGLRLVRPRPTSFDRLPRSWGPFELRREIVRGSLSTVYVSWDPHLEREIAVKIVDGPDRSTAVQEARLLTRVRHSNVATVYGVDQFDGAVGIRMELIEGRTLKQILDQEGVRGAKEATLIGIDLCRALAALHNAKGVHRDIEVQNVMRESTGRIVLMAFGAGVTRMQDPTSPARLSVTPQYLAPEIFDGSPATIVTDIYSLGVLLYHLVTKRYPFEGDTLEAVALAHAQALPLRLIDLRPNLPAAFIRVVEQAIEHDPAFRYRSSDAMLHDLAAALEIGIGASPSAQSTSGDARVTSVAVRPVVSLGPDQDLEYFRDGLVEELLTVAEPNVHSLADTDCHEVFERLSAELDGELPAAEAEAVRKHVRSCAACARKRSLLQQTQRVFRSVPYEEVDSTFDIGVRRKLRRQSMRRWQLAVAAVLILVAGSVVLVRPPQPVVKVWVLPQVRLPAAPPASPAVRTSLAASPATPRLPSPSRPGLLDGRHAETPCGDGFCSAPSSGVKKSIAALSE